MNVLVLDVGTSSMRGILFSAEGAALASAQCPYRADYMEDDGVEQSPSDWEEAMYGIFRSISAEAMAKHADIDAVSITAQRSSVIPVDRDMIPLHRAIMWQDKRSAKICRQLECENEEIFRRCGSKANTVFSAGKMAWFRKYRPDIYKNTYKFTGVADYLVYLLTGNLCTDYTYGSRTLLMNIYTHKWDADLLKLFEVEEEKLCPLVPPGSISGYLGKDAAERTGCREGIPVITAGGDQQCGTIGQGVVQEGFLSVTAGTGGFLITAVEEIPKNLQPNVICNVSSIKGQYILESSVLTCCSAFDWFCRNFYEECSYEEINRIVEKTPIGSNEVVCLPYFQGRSTPDWNYGAPGMFSNITLHTGKADLLRALLEGICYEIQNGIDVMKEYVDVKHILINGGLANSDVFNQMQCDVCDIELIRRGETDATARGALMVALQACGVFTTVQEAFQCISRQDKVSFYHPDRDKKEKYQKCREKMNEIYHNLYM